MTSTITTETGAPCMDVLPRWSLGCFVPDADAAPGRPRPVSDTPQPEVAKVGLDGAGCGTNPPDGEPRNCPNRPRGPRRYPPRVNFSVAGLKRGYIAAQPLALGVFIYGLTFGLLARTAGLS